MVYDDTAAATWSRLLLKSLEIELNNPFTFLRLGEAMIHETFLPFYDFTPFVHHLVCLLRFSSQNQSESWPTRSIQNSILLQYL